MGELKPCPFCGRKAKIVKRPNGMFEIGCEDFPTDCYGNVCLDAKCKGCTDGYAKRKYAVEAWNTRFVVKESE